MSTDKIDPKKDANISSADDLAKTPTKSDVELTEDQLAKVSGGIRKSGGDPGTTGIGF